MTRSSATTSLFQALHLISYFSLILVSSPLPPSSLFLPLQNVSATPPPLQRFLNPHPIQSKCQSRTKNRTENKKWDLYPCNSGFSSSYSSTFLSFFSFLPFLCCCRCCLKDEFLSHETEERNRWALKKHTGLRDGSGSHNVIFVLKACQAVSIGRKEGMSGKRGWLGTQRCQTCLSPGG